MDQISDARVGQTSPLLKKPIRVALIDLLRGIALLAMIVFHFSWDLQFLSLADLNVTGNPLWIAFAHATAGSFLATVGVSLVLAHGDGIRIMPFWRRLGMVVVAAGVITLASWYADPNSPILFGILHCIAVSSVLGLAFLRPPVWFVLIGAAVCLTAPAVWTSPAFNGPAWAWLGLASDPQPADDYIPLLPWFGLVLTGIAAARLALAYRPREAWARWQPRHLVSRILALGGRHALVVYLLHQPILLGVLWVVAQTLAAKN